MRTLLLLLSVGCTKAPEVPPPPPRPTLAVVVPLSGPDAAVGVAALDGATLAAGSDVEVLAVDDARPDVVAELVASPAVFGVVAHATRTAAEAHVDAWAASELPVVSAAPGEYTGLPRVVPPLTASVRCAAALVDGPFVVRTDMSTVGMEAGKALLRLRSDYGVGMTTVDPAQVSSEAARLGRAPALVWAGDAAEGGNLLRALRGVGSDVPFLGVGLYDGRFLAAAGALAEGARVTSDGRPANDPAFVTAYTQKRGAAPTAPAVDAYDAARLLLAARTAASQGGAEPTRSGIRAALATVEAQGASGPMHLDADGVLQPVLCGAFRVEKGGFVFEKITSEADIPPPEPARRRRRGRRR